MELSHSLILNEEALKEIPETKKHIFVYEWLRFLDKVLVAAQKSDIKECQKKLVDQLLEVMQNYSGPPTRKLVACCLATMFSVGDTFLLFDTVNKCNDILRNKDDSPSYVQTKLAAIDSIGYMYQKLGRMMGRSYEDTVHILIKSLKNADSLSRIEIMSALEKVCCGMGVAITNVHKDVYKAARTCLTDRVMSVRCAASKCLLEMLKHAPFLYTSELESMVTLCFRAFDSANYEARFCIAKLLGTVVASTQNHPAMSQISPGNQVKCVKEVSIDDAFALLMSGFLKGGTGFLKGTGEIIKGGSAINREVRVGVTHAYVVFIQILGSDWLERNLNYILNHILDLVANPKSASSHIDAVYSRKCINFILRSTLGRMLCEKAQISACKELAVIIAKQMSSIDFSPENAKDCNQETLFGQHLLVCALQELGLLILSLGTTASALISDNSFSLIEAVTAVLVHPCHAARLAAAWALRCVCIAVHGQCTILINRCVEGLENKKTVSEAISGYSSALAAVLGGVKFSPLGVPYSKGKIIFNTAEELLRSASQNSRLSLHRTQAGWLLIGAIMTLGSSVVRPLLPRMVLIWRNCFPRSTKELESEKARGDAFTWQITLEGRAGALSSIYSFLSNCRELVNEDIIRRLLTPIESAITMLVNIGPILKSYGQHVKAPAATVRHRLYEVLSLVPPQAFEGSYTHILRLLVSEFTLSENPANTTTSQLRAACYTDESLLLNLSPFQHSDHAIIEDQLLANSASGSGALEHDPCCLYRPVAVIEELPGPLPLGVAVIDSSVVLFGLIFPRVANKHRLQILEHFVECVRHCKSSRADAVTLNLFASILVAMKGLIEAKSSVGQDDAKNAMTSFIMGTITNGNVVLRCAAAESLGRLAQVVGEPKFTAELTQTSFERLKSARDIASRTGHSLALGCIHRYVGGMGSSQHLNTSVSILLALAQDSTSPVVQLWSLYALSLIAESGGPMFRGYVEPSLSLCLKLLLTVAESHVDVHHCIGKVLSALITVIGPELQGNSQPICETRSSFLCACAILQDHQGALVQAEAISCLQQLHLFAPKYVNLSSFVPVLCKKLSSHHLLLRKAAVSCLRQLTQREAKEVCEYALLLANEQAQNGTKETNFLVPETGFPGLLFRMLDTETDSEMIKHIHDTLISILQMTAADNLIQWLSLCKSVLTIAADLLKGTETQEENGLTEDGEDDGDDQLEFKTKDDNTEIIHPRWPTKVFAASCLRRIITTCHMSSPAHFDLALAKELRLSKNNGDYLVLHLPELIRMGFIAATSDCDQLRLEGLRTLHIIIEKFCKVPEPEFPGHLLLEQFQAQIGAALRPAFSNETASHVTAAACSVCSAWIGSGVAKDLNDLRRVHQLLVSSLDKLQNTTGLTALYNESLATLEKLSILKAWAEVYITAMIDNGFAPGYSGAVNSSSSLSSGVEIKKINDDNEQNYGDNADASEEDEFGTFEFKGESLLSLVQPELVSLAKHWLAALRDHALLQLPSEYANQLPHDGGAFYTNDTVESCRCYYLTTWPAFIYAVTLWLTSGEFKIVNADHMSKKEVNSLTEKFGLIFGICMESLCNSRSVQTTENILTCLRSLYTLFTVPYPRKLLTEDSALPVEICNTLHRLILTQDEIDVHKWSMNVLKQVIKAVEESSEIKKRIKFKELYPDDKEIPFNDAEELDLIGEGGKDGEINTQKGFVFAVLEVCLCLLAKHMPAVNPSVSISPVAARQKYSIDDVNQLIAVAVSSMEVLPSLCSPAGAISVLPTILYLTTCSIKEAASNSYSSSKLSSNNAISAGLHLLRSFSRHKYCFDKRSSDKWQSLLQSTLAKLIDMAKTGSDDVKVDEIMMMLSLSALVLNAPADVTSNPNLQYPCINYFKQCLQNDNIQVRIKCVQTLKHLFHHNDKTISGSYILSLAPRLVEYLHSEQLKHIETEAELVFCMEVIGTVESLVRIADPDQGVNVLSLLVPALVHLLLDDVAFKTANKYRKSLHEYSLQWLTKIGPQYPQEFKIVMSQTSDLRPKLESAIRSNAQHQQQQRNRLDLKNGNSSTNGSIKLPQRSAVPTIKLKTNFNNFSS